MAEPERNISLVRARELIGKHVTTLGTEAVPLDRALGRVLATPVCADRDQPAFDRVTMDGIAIQYREGQQCWHVRGVQFAGETPLRLKDSGDCVQVMTGTQLPEGADTVIPIEWLQGKSSEFHLLPSSTVEFGQMVHRKGSDCRTGDPLIPEGTLLNAAAWSLCASVGATQLQVKRLPRIAFVSTGNELVDVSEIPGAQSIRRSNDRVVAAECAKAGLSLHACIHLPDDPGVIETTLHRLLGEVDWVVFSGGVSMGKADHIPDCVRRCGFEILFHKVRQKPGGPLLFAKHASGCGLLGLPGNPVSSLVCSRLYLRLIFQYQSGFPLGDSWVPLAEPGPDDSEKTRLLPVHMERSPQGDIRVRPVPTNTSGDMVSVIHSDGLLILPPVNERSSDPHPALEFLNWNT